MDKLQTLTVSHSKPFPYVWAIKGVPGESDHGSLAYWETFYIESIQALIKCWEKCNIKG